MIFNRLTGSLERVQRLTVSGIIAAVALVFLILYRALAIQFITDNDFGYVIATMLGSWKYRLIGVVAYIVVMLAVFYAIKYKNKVVPILYKYRVAIGVIIVAVCTLFEISGSSIGMWAKTLPDAAPSGLLLGTPRWFRTDEFATTLAEVFAQFNDSAGYLPYFGTVFRGTQTDMFVSGIPVFDIAALLRPFSWGYIVFGLSRGLAFYWSARSVSLFLLTFEVSLRLMGEKKKLAFPIAVLVTFSSAVCWWGSADILIYSEALFLVGIRFFSSRNEGGWIGWSIVFFWLVGALIATLYPAWIVPYALLFLCLGIAYLVHNKATLSFSPGRQLICCIPGLAVLVFLGIHIFSLSSEAMTLLSSTSYPGARTDFGGGNPAFLFRSLVNLFTPLSVEGLSTLRPDNTSSIMCLYPFGMLLAGYLALIKKRRDSILVTLLAVEIVYSVYFFVGFSEFLARITLMSYTISERIAVVIELIDLLLLVKSCSLLDEALEKRRAVLLSGIVAAATVGLNIAAESSYFDLAKVVVAATVAFLFIYYFFYQSAIGMAAVSISIALFSGVLVNPVQVGISVVEDNELICDVRELAQESDRKWIVQTDWAENIAAFGGAPTINSTQYYPNFDFWNELDPDGNETEIYNRFSHPRITLTPENGEPEISLSGSDVISVTLPISYLEKFNVGYVLTQTDLDYLNANDMGIEFNLISEYTGYYIYEVDW